MNNKNLYLIASYPRSGNHWVRYIIEHITQRPTLGADKSDVPLCEKISSLKTNGKPIAVKTHHMGIGRFNAKKMMGLIVLVRNYKEVLIRHNSYINDNNFENKYEGVTPNYIKIIKTYHKWSGPKIMLYYEDLISEPVKSIRVIGNFIKNINLKKMKDITENIDKHKEVSISYYDKKAKAGSVTKGKSLIFHSNKITAIHRKKWDTYIEKTWPNLYKDYLVRYQE